MTPENENKTLGFTESWTYFVVREYLKQGVKALSELKKDVFDGVTKLKNYEDNLKNNVSNIIEQVSNANTKLSKGENISKEKAQIKNDLSNMGWDVNFKVAEKISSSKIELNNLKKILPKEMLQKVMEERKIETIKEKISNKKIKNQVDFDR